MNAIVCRLLLCTLLLTVNLSAGAQPAKKVARIGYAELPIESRRSSSW